MLDLNQTYKKIDIRAEVLLAELLEKTSAFDNKEIVLCPTGDFNKSLRTDISEIVFRESALENDGYDIKLVRKGLYDTLPSGLFHDPTSKIDHEDKSKKTDRILQDIKERKQQEKEARQFFAPFDQSFNYYRLLLEDEERKVLTGFPVGSRHTLFDIIWGGFGNSMTNYQKSALFSILPMAHSIAGNLPYTALAFHAILGYQTEITVEREQGTIKQEVPTNVLGNTFLSQDSILGSTSEEQELIYKIKIHHIPTTKIIDFLPKGKTRQVVKILCGFFLPAELSYDCTYDFECESLHLDSSTGHDVYQNRLGYGITL